MSNLLLMYYETVPKSWEKNEEVKKRAISSEENTNVQTKQSSYQKETLGLEAVGNITSWCFL